MNKKQFLNTYRNIDGLKPSVPDQADTKKPQYRSENDERLIKDFHFAKFQKNQEKIYKNEELKKLIEKEEWEESDIETLLKSLK